MDELLDKLRMEGFLLYDYADDVAIIARGKFLSVLKGKMSYSQHILNEWCGRRTLSVNTNKICANIFTRRYNVTLPEPLKFRGVEIEYTTSVKYLGIHLDVKLH